MEDSRIMSKDKLDLQELPAHIAIIMDGNGRWAKNKGLQRNFGHREGMDRVIEIVEASKELGINHLTLYAFSTENWRRPDNEIKGLMKILVYFIRRELAKLIENKVKINILGDIDKLPDFAKVEVYKAVEDTKDNDQMILNIALNYGGRDEIIHGVKDILKDYKMGKIKIEDLDDRLFSTYLYTKGQPDPDLVIRSSWDIRVSNFLLYQIAYSELYFTDTLWPDFHKEELYKAILDYQNRNRRYGGI